MIGKSTSTRKSLADVVDGGLRDILLNIVLTLELDEGLDILRRSMIDIAS